MSVFGKATLSATLKTSVNLDSGSGAATDDRTTDGTVFDNEGNLVTVSSGTVRHGGARLSGSDWFETNTDGSAIADSLLLGRLGELAATNMCLRNRDLTLNLTGTENGWVGSATGAELLTEPLFDNAGAGWTVTGDDGTHVVTFAANTMRYESDTTTPTLEVKDNGTPLVIGQQYVVTIAVNAYASGKIKVDGANVQIISSATTKTVGFTATKTTFAFERITSNVDITLDSISVKLSGIQMTPDQTGIDNIANTATLLTSGAANQTMIQKISTAAASRSLSVYIKRSVGTGTIEITRDGGSTYTDVTSLINSSTWIRVSIKNTSVLDPEVGFRIVTSGDAIIVDYVQDEAGAFVTSPILTTTTSVTRGADSLYYQTSGNFSDTTGAIAARVYMDDWASASGSIGSATTGLFVTPINSGGQAQDGTNTVNADTGTPSGTVRIAIGWTGSTLKIAVDGVLAASGTYDGSFNLTTFIVGIVGYTRDLHAWTSGLSDVELMQASLAESTDGKSNSRSRSRNRLRIS